MQLPRKVIFSGDGVSNNIFFPNIAGPGRHDLYYRYGEGTLCYTEAQNVIEVKESCNNTALLPNAFTPNGDGINDVFRIPDGTLKTLAEFSIYDRWGKKVFTTSSLGVGWDGKYRNNFLESGVYVYFISGIRKDGTPANLKGIITLLK